MTQRSALPLPPVTGAWRHGDPVGQRLFADLGTLPLYAGGVLPQVELAYQTWGTLAPDASNAVLVLHALTGDSHVCGEAGPGHPSPGWWNGLVGPGRAIDTDVWFVVAPNVLGGCQGSTGPASPAPAERDPLRRPWGSRFPQVTLRDQVAAESRLGELLGIKSWACVIGGSMGGMRVLEHAVATPERVRTAVVLAAGAYASAEQIAWTVPQLAVIEADPHWAGGDYYDAAPGAGPHVGLGIARQIAHVTYRSEAELAVRFGRLPQHEEDPLLGGRFAVESYLQYHGTKLAHRFDAGSYVSLTHAMNSHDIGRDRGGVASALQQVSAAVWVAAIDSDRLYPPYQQAELVALTPTARPLVTIPSPYGHDGFLLEVDAVGEIVVAALKHAAVACPQPV